MRWSMRKSAEPYERFVPGSWDKVVGTQTPVRIRGEIVRYATLVAATVADDGRSVDLTFDDSASPSSPFMGE